MKAAYEKFHSRGFEILGMNHEQGKDFAEGMQKARDCIAKLACPWPQAAQESIDELTTERFLVYGYPTTVLLDPKGKIIEVNPKGERLSEVLEELLGKRSNTKKTNAKLSE